MDGLNDQSLLDVRKLISGKDGRLFVTTKAGINIFLAEVDTFQAQISPANTDYQPVGSSLIYSVNTGYSVTLTLTEAATCWFLIRGTATQEISGCVSPCSRAMEVSRTLKSCR